MGKRRALLVFWALLFFGLVFINATPTAPMNRTGESTPIVKTDSAVPATDLNDNIAFMSEESFTTTSSATGTFTLAESFNRSRTYFTVDVQEQINNDDSNYLGFSFHWVADNQIGWQRYAANSYTATINFNLIEFTAASGVLTEEFGPYNGHTAVTVTSYNMSKSFVVQQGSCGSLTYFYTRCWGMVYQSADDTVQVANGGQSDSWSYLYFTHVYGPDIYVQHGNTQKTAASVSQSISSVDTAHSFILSQQKNTLNNYGWRYYSTETYFSDSTHIVLYSGSYVVQNYVYWQVIEWPDTYFDVQHVSDSMTTAMTSKSTTISSVDTSRTISWLSGSWGPYTSGGSRLTYTGGNVLYHTVQSYITGSTTAFTGTRGASSYYIYYYITVVSAVVSNTAPTNVQSPSNADLDDTDNMYARLKDYSVVTYTSDVDGYTDISYIDLYIYDNTRTTNDWIVRYNNTDNSFSEQADASNYITLNTSSSSASRSGNFVNATFEIMLNWNHPDYTDIDLRVIVVDSAAASDDDYYEVNWDTNSALMLLSSSFLSDGSGTTDRGNYDTVGGITASGTIIYTYTTSYIPPPSDQADVWVNCSDVAGSPWSDTTLVGGGWSVAVDSDDVVGLDTYDVIVVDEGAGSGGTDLFAISYSDNYIADRVQVSTCSASDDRTNINDNVNIDFTLIYDYDDSAVTDGTVTINGYSASHQGSGVWRITRTSASVTSVTYNTVATSGNTHGITSVDMNSQSTTVIWDQIVVQTTVVDDSRVNINDNVEIRVTLWLAYDSTYLGSGDSVTLDGTAMTWDAANSWFDLSRTKAAVGLWRYFVNSSSEATYGITALDVNGQYVDVIFDEIEVYVSGVTDSRTNINENEWPLMRLRLKYDGHLLDDGTNDAVYINGSLATWLSPNWHTVENMGTVGSWFFLVTSASENTYGITSLDASSASSYGVSIIWDRIQVQSYSVADDRLDVNTPMNIDVLLYYEYDSTALTTGTVTINGVSATHQGSGTWRIVQQSSNVVAWLYNTVATGGDDTYGISEVDQNSQSVTVIWDRLKVTAIGANATSVLSGQYVLIYATVVYEYDSTPMTAGTSITIEGIAMTYNSTSSQWECTDMESSPTSNTYDTMAGTGTLYSITVWNMNSKTVTVTWSDNLIDVTLTINYGWTVVGYNITISWTATYEPSGVPFSGTVTINSTGSTFYPTYSTTGLRSFEVTAVTDPLYGITDFSTNSVSVTWDSVLCTSISYTWEMFDLIQKQMVLTTGTFQWEINGTNIGINQHVLVYVNSTTQVDDYTDASSQIGTERIGPFGQSWYFGNFVGNATATVGARSFTDTWWDITIPIPVEHTIHLADFDANEGDDGIWFVWSTIWNNGTLSLWDNDTLITYIDADPSTYYLTKSTVIGMHNLTILINCTDTGGHQSEQSKDFSASDYWIWLNYYYTVRNTLEVGNIVVSYTDTLVYVQCWLKFSGNYYVYENDSYISTTGSFSAYSTIAFYWSKSTGGTYLWAVKFNNTAGSTGYIYGAYYKAAAAAEQTDTESTDVFTSVEETLYTWTDMFTPDVDDVDGPNQILSSNILLANQTDIVYELSSTGNQWRPLTFSGYSSFGGSATSDYIEMWAAGTVYGTGRQTHKYNFMTYLTPTTDQVLYFRYKTNIVMSITISFVGSGGTFTIFSTTTAADTWATYRAYDLTSIVTSGDIQSLQFYASAPHTGACNDSLYVDYIYITNNYMDEDLAGYHNSFASADMLTASSCSLSTDYDILTATENGAGTTARFYASFSSFSYQYYYYEIAVYDVQSGAQWKLQFYDGTTWYDLTSLSSSKGVFKGIINSAHATTMTRIGVYFEGDGLYIKLDYLMIASADEMGWRHDGSDDIWIDASGGGTTSATGGVTTLQADTDGSTFTFYFDQSATSMGIGSAHYLMMRVNWAVASVGTFTLYAHGSTTYQFGSITASGTSGSDEFAFCQNDGLTGYSGEMIDYFYITVSSNGMLKFDEIYLYTVAYFSVTLDSYSTYDDPFKKNTSSGCIETWGANEYTFTYDKAISIDGAKYNIFNFDGQWQTLYGWAGEWNTIPVDALPDFGMYSDSAWHTVSNTQRGDSYSGTITAVRISGAYVAFSELSFITALTTPTFVNTWANPVDPDSSEQVTVYCEVTGTNLYGVLLTAQYYPAGWTQPETYMVCAFYSGTKQGNYTFTTLDAGYYLFYFTVTDGTDTATGILAVTVTESAIIITNDFALVQDTGLSYQGTINTGANVTVYENNVAVATSEIPTASKFSIWWDRAIGSGNITATLYFYNAVASLNVTVTYERLAATSFAIEVWDLDFGDVYINIYCTTSFGNTTLYIYDNGVYKAYSAEADVVQYRKSSTEGEHVLSIKVDWGSNHVWKNYTYGVAIMVEAMKIVVLQWDTGSPSSVTGMIQTNWNNATITLTDSGGTTLDSGTENGGGYGVPFSFKKVETSGVIHLVTVTIESGSSTITLVLGYSWVNPNTGGDSTDPRALQDFIGNATQDAVNEALGGSVVIPPAVFAGLVGVVVLAVTVIFAQWAWNWRKTTNRKHKQGLAGMAGYLGG